jgi:DNA-binding MarR family transcriptional regulator
MSLPRLNKIDLLLKFMLKLQHMKAINTGRLLGMLWFRLNRRLSANLKVAGLNITADQLRLLNQLAENESCNQLFLAKQLGRDRSAITRMIQHLELKAWVSRKPDKEDKRAFVVVLTKPGYLLQETAAAVAQQTLDELWAGFRTEEKDQCSDYLFRMAQNVR